MSKDSEELARLGREISYHVKDGHSIWEKHVAVMHEGEMRLLQFKLAEQLERIIRMEKELSIEPVFCKHCGKLLDD